MLKRENSKQKPKKLNRHTSLTRSDRREGGGGGTRSRAAIIADVAFISLWRLYREKKHMFTTNGCVFRIVLKFSAKYKLYTCDCTQPRPSIIMATETGAKKIFRGSTTCP